jgi:hypothetical protein
LEGKPRRFVFWAFLFCYLKIQVMHQPFKLMGAMAAAHPSRSITARELKAHGKGLSTTSKVLIWTGIRSGGAAVVVALTLRKLLLEH